MSRIQKTINLVWYLNDCLWYCIRLYRSRARKEVRIKTGKRIGEFTFPADVRKVAQIPGQNLWWVQYEDRSTNTYSLSVDIEQVLWKKHYNDRYRNA